MENIKAVVVGDGTVGKTCMLISFTDNKFPLDHLPTIFDNYSANISFCDRVVHLDLWDTAGQDDYDMMRPLSYPHTDIFMVCFSLISHVSFDNAMRKWIPELKTYMQTHEMEHIPLLMIGTKKDLRDELLALDSNNKTIVDSLEAQHVAKQAGCTAYYECSALTQDGLKQVFDATIATAMETKLKQRHQKPSGMKSCMPNCNIM